MRAVVIRKHGGPDVLSYEDIKDPKPRKGHAIIKVNCCAVNHLDIWVRNGLPGRKVSFPHVLGCDICGTLVEDAGNFKKDETVVVYPAIESNTPRTAYSIIGGFSNYHGGYAEFVRVPESNIIRKPKWLSDIEACALNVSYLTAWNMLEKSRCNKGDTILIWGANSGVGSAAILLAKGLGLKVISVASNSKKVTQAKKIGSDLVINRKRSDVATEVLKHTTNEGVDIVVDHVGAKTWPISIEVLNVGGKMVTCGTTSGAEAKVNIRTLYSKEAKIIGTYLGSKSQLISLHKFMKLKKIRPIIDSVFDLKETKLGHKKMESGQMFGKIVLKI